MLCVHCASLNPFRGRLLITSWISENPKKQSKWKFMKCLRFFYSLSCCGHLYSHTLQTKWTSAWNSILSKQLLVSHFRMNSKIKLGDVTTVNFTMAEVTSCVSFIQPTGMKDSLHSSHLFCFCRVESRWMWFHLNSLLVCIRLLHTRSRIGLLYWICSS